MAPRRGRQSNQGLVIALVFCVLIILGLGVSTYYGFNGKDAALKAEDKAKQDLAKITDDRNWYKFQAQLYRSYMGHTEGIDAADLGSAKSQFESGALGKSASDREGVTKLIKETLERKLQWDPAQNRPKLSYEALLQQEKERSDNAEKLASAAQDAKLAAEKAAKKALDDLKAERATFDDKLAQLNKKAESDLGSYLAQTKQNRDDIKLQSEKNEEIRKAASEDKKKSDDALASANRQIKGLGIALNAKKEAFEQLQNKGVDIAPKGWQTDWRIVSMDPRGKEPFINLGSADHVHPQLTFSIHAQGPDGRPVTESKGSLEVVTIINDHLSQARLLTVKDPHKEPIMKGDILYNPSWNPTLKRHIALAGSMDLAGDGRDATFELIRNLERQNVVVDAYIDLRDNTIKGKGISEQTDYLVVGDPVNEQLGGSDRAKEAATKRIDEIGKLKKQAREHGVQEISMRKYLEAIGYRLPRASTEVGAGGQEARPESAAPRASEPAGQPTEEKKDDKAGGDEKPAEDKPK